MINLDNFGKIFRDPDGDGSNYVEFETIPGNNVFDAWYKQGFADDKGSNRDRCPHVSWICRGS